MSFSKEFKSFILRGNAFDTAIGVVFGVVFSNVVNSLVKDILLPPIGFFFSGIDFTELSLKLYVPGSGRPPIEMRWGSFLNAVFNFLIVSLATFLVVKAINVLRQLELKQKTLQYDCPECLMSIPVQAKRCGHCGFQIYHAQEGFVNREHGIKGNLPYASSGNASIGSPLQDDHTR